MTFTLTYTGRLVVTSCWCGIHMAVPSDLDNYARRQGQAIYCPLGHKFVYGDTVKQQLAEAERQLKEAHRARAATRELLHHEERSHAATRGHLTRQKNRVAAGVCPVPECQRHFKDLRRHMKSQHPDYSGKA